MQYLLIQSTGKVKHRQTVHTSRHNKGIRAKEYNPQNRQEIQNQGECSELQCKTKQDFTDN